MDDASGIASLIETARLLKASGVQDQAVGAVRGPHRRGEGPARIALLRVAADRAVQADRGGHQRGHVPAALPSEVSRGAGHDRVVARRYGPRGRGKSLGVEVQTDREPEQNRFIRSDQYSFIQKGVPALAFKFGYEFGSPEETMRKNWVRDVYHKPNDDSRSRSNKEAAALFDRVIMTLLQRVANDTARPTWNADSFFKRFAK